MGGGLRTIALLLVLPASLWAAPGGGDAPSEAEAPVGPDAAQGPTEAVDAPPEDPDRKALLRMAPDAVEAWDAAQAARAGGDLDAALAGYRSVLKQAPRFDPAARRACLVLNRQKEWTEAKPLCSLAIELDDSPRNALGLAGWYAGRWDTEFAYRAKGIQLVRDASFRGPDDPEVQLETCRLAWLLRDFDLLPARADRLTTLKAEDPLSWYFASLARVQEDDHAAAELAIARAAELGLDPARVERTRALFTSARPTSMKLETLAMSAGLLWAAWIAALLAVGGVFSGLTWALAARLRKRESARVRGLMRLFLLAYRGLLWVTSATWYASIPFLFVAIGGLGWFAWSLVTSMRVVPVYLLFVIAAATVGAWGALLSGFFVSWGDGEYDGALDLAEHPRLRALLREVADAVGTEPVTEVFLHREWRRCLNVGLGFLQHLRIGELKPILAHEMGHFAQGDTSTGRFALRSRVRLAVTLESVQRSGRAHALNPGWVLPLAYAYLVAWVSAGAARLQEVLADRTAVRTYGGHRFAQSMVCTINESVRFNLKVERLLQEAEVAQPPMVLLDLYGTDPKHPPPEAKVQDRVQEAFHRPPSAFDSHPPPIDPIAWAEDSGVVDVPWTAEDADPAFDLFRRMPQLRQAMTAEVRQTVELLYGIRFCEDDGPVRVHSVYRPM
jgi:Zn-dependent protease with chaperone function